MLTCKGKVVVDLIKIDCTYIWNFKRAYKYILLNILYVIVSYLKIKLMRYENYVWTVNENRVYKKMPFWIYYKVCLIFSEISLLEIKQVLVNNVISDLYCLSIDFI